MGSCSNISKSWWQENWQDRLCSFGELTTEQRGLKEAESCSENIFGCQRIFDKYKLFNKGGKDLYQKAMPADVVEQIKKSLPVSEWVGVKTDGG